MLKKYLANFLYLSLWYKILYIVDNVTTTGSYKHNKHKEDEEPILKFGTKGKADHCLKASQTEEGKVLDVALDD